VDRAFKKLVTIKSSIVWWKAGAQPPQLLASGELGDRRASTTAASWMPTRRTRRTSRWCGTVRSQVPDMWAIVKGGKNVELAQELVRFATGTQPLADQAKYIPYAPARQSSVAKIPASEPEQGLAANAGHPGRAMLTDAKFWTDYGDDLNKRFSAWMAK